MLEPIVNNLKICELILSLISFFCPNKKEKNAIAINNKANANLIIFFFSCENSIIPWSLSRWNIASEIEPEPYAGIIAHHLWWPSGGMIILSWYKINIATTINR